MIFRNRATTNRLEGARVGDRVNLRGKIIARDHIESPLTADRCVYYNYTIQQWHESATGTALAGDGFWRDLEGDEAITEFYLAVGDERLIISPANAKVDRASGPTMVDVDYKLVGQRARQILLTTGNEIEVSGVLDHADDLFDDARDYRALAERFMIRAPDQGKLKIRVF